MIYSLLGDRAPAVVVLAIFAFVVFVFVQVLRKGIADGRRADARRGQLAQVARAHGWVFSPCDPGGVAGLPVGYLAYKRAHAKNVVIADYGSTRVWMCDLDVESGNGDDYHVAHFTYAITAATFNCPVLTINRRDSGAGSLRTESDEFNRAFVSQLQARILNAVSAFYEAS